MTEQTLDLFTYPSVPGWKGAGGTSKAAAEDMKPSKANLQAKVLEALKKHGPLTTEEIEKRTGLKFKAIQPRTSELKVLGKIEDSGDRRANASGKMAIVWQVRA